MKDSTAGCADTPILSEFRTQDIAPEFTASFYLVDQAKEPEALKRLFELDPQPVYDLPYLYSGDRDAAFAGPLLIEPDTDTARTWLQQWTLEGRALALAGTGLQLQDVRDHLVTLTRIRTPHGEALFRYADPLSLASVGASLTACQRLRILGPLSGIHGYCGGRHWALARAEAAGSAMAGELFQKPLELSRENFDVVEAFRQDLLASALAENTAGLEPQMVKGWFRQLRALGAPSEQGLMEAASLLIRAGRSDLLQAGELARLRAAGELWSDRLEALAALETPQESVQEGP